MGTVAEHRCYRIGCGALFALDDNPDESCRYHPGPVFHDGGKEWSCCKQRSHDFSLFIDIPGCQTGKHSSEKPQQPKATPATQSRPVSLSAKSEAVTVSNCSRCRQGFFCSDHGNRMPQKAPTIATSTPAVPLVQAPVTVTPKIVDLNAKQTCKNSGCGIEYLERDNADDACSFHPGPPVFHDRSRGWKCCDVYVKEFDEFLEIPPCSKGWHNANPPQKQSV